MIEVRMCGSTGTVIDVVPTRITPTFQVQHNDTGTWKMLLRTDDPILVRTPTLLAYRNIVLMRVGGYTFAGRLEKKHRVLIGEGELAEGHWEVSGRGVLCLTQDATTYPEYGLVRTASQDRWFSFISKTDTWYKTGQWAAPLGVVYSADTTTRAGRPSHWPDASAQWIWKSNPSTSAPGGEVIYFRKSLTITSAARYTISVTCDNEYVLWVDGQQVASGSDWNEYQRVIVTLSAGTHVFAARAVNHDIPVPSNPAGFLLTVQATDTAGMPVVMRSDTTWRWASETATPKVGWNAGEVVTALRSEAIARGVGAMSALTPTWTATNDSAGVAWTSVVDRAFTVGTDVLDVITQLAETSCDVRVNGDLTFDLIQTLGTDRTVGATPVILRPMRDISSHEFDGDVSGLRNVLLVQTDTALTETSDATSVAANSRVEGYLQVGGALSDNTSNLVVAYALAQRKNPLESFTIEIAPVTGQIPLVDWFVGDWILVPNEMGVLASHRAKAITIGEDADGRIRYVPELATILQDREARYNRWLKSIANGTLGGSVASAGPISGSSTVGSAGSGSGSAIAATARPSVFFQRDRFPTGTGVLAAGATSLTLTRTPISGSIHVYLNGLVLNQGTDFTLSGVTMTLPSGVAAIGDVVDCLYAYNETSATSSTTAPVIAPAYVGPAWTSTGGKAYGPVGTTTTTPAGSDGLLTDSDYTNTFDTNRTNLGPEWAYVQNGAERYAVIDTGHTDFTIQADVTFTGSDAGLVFIDPDFTDRFVWDYGKFASYQPNGGSAQNQGSGTTSGGPHTLKIEKVGQVVKCYYDGALTQTMTVTATIPSDVTLVGFYTKNSTDSFDNIVVTMTDARTLPSAPVSSFSDNFNRSNAVLTTPWYFPNGGSWSVVSNAAYVTANATTGPNMALVNLTTGIVDMTLNQVAGVTGNLVFDHAGTDYWLGQWDGSNFGLYRFVNNVNTSTSFPVGGIIGGAGGAGVHRIVVTPTGGSAASVAVYKNGTLMGTRSITLGGGGGYGIASDNPTPGNGYDDFSVTVT